MAIRCWVDVTEEMEENARRIVAIWGGIGTLTIERGGRKEELCLDYSPRSLWAFGSYPLLLIGLLKEKDPHNITHIYKGLGAYLGEVIRRNYKDDSISIGWIYTFAAGAGADKFVPFHALQIGDYLTNPVQEVQMSVRNEDPERLSLYYQHLQSELTELSMNGRHFKPKSYPGFPYVLLSTFKLDEYLAACRREGNRSAKPRFERSVFGR